MMRGGQKKDIRETGEGKKDISKERWRRWNIKKRRENRKYTNERYVKIKTKGIGKKGDGRRECMDLKFKKKYLLNQANLRVSNFFSL